MGRRRRQPHLLTPSRRRCMDRLDARIEARPRPSPRGRGVRAAGAGSQTSSSSLRKRSEPRSASTTGDPRSWSASPAAWIFSKEALPFTSGVTGTSAREYLTVQVWIR